eukprot:CAMPEP_0119487886 /NCGR_PEP_ID=MMETSP1344-20130328/13834_1 /TAXON_ID=236787 /ORGANISM="Florenciella parvula, Strain CCMP2471" /LENGTH=62 /DNA_ID=CAMNT_0007522787 /DNA_START=70 /DNA_END=258 /DNA_ORIENTATION=+
MAVCTSNPALPTPSAASTAPPLSLLPPPPPPAVAIASEAAAAPVEQCTAMGGMLAMMVAGRY